MSILNYLCNYCNHRFVANSYKKEIRCTKCDDSNVKEIKPVDKVNYYPEEDIKEKNLQKEFYDYLINGNSD